MFISFDFSCSLMFILLFPDVALPPFQTILGHASDGRAPVSDAAGSHSLCKACTVHVCLLMLHGCKPEVCLILGKTVAVLPTTSPAALRLWGFKSWSLSCPEGCCS